MQKSDKHALLVTSEFPPQPGGIGNHAFNLVRGLTAKSFRVCVHTDIRSADGVEDLAFDRSHKLNVIRIRRHRSLPLIIFRRLRGYMQGVSSMPKGSIVFASGKFSLLMVGILSFIFRHKYVAVLHGVDINPTNPWLRRLTYWCLRRFDLLIAVSDFTKRVMLSHNPNLKIEVINNGFELDLIPDNSEEEKKVRGWPALITVGNVTFRKGQQNVIRALKVLQNSYPDIHYHIVGIPTEKEKFSILARERGIADHVTFHGAVSNFKLQELLAGADIFCMLSEEATNGDFEGFGIAILEANAVGLPAIGSKDSGIADAIDHGHSGVLVDPHQDLEVLSALDLILADYPRFSESARERSEQFRWSRVIEKYEEKLNLLV